MMTIEPAKDPEIFSREWYNEYFQRADGSAAHAQFCEQVYGRDLCQHGMMDIQELDFLISLLEPRAKILEIGCSNGHISEYIHDRTGCEITGLDYSDVAIEQARGRTKSKAGKLHFEQVDLTQDEIPGQAYDVILLIDSIYFLGELRATVEKVAQKLKPTGKMIIAYFQVKEDGQEGDILADGTELAQALNELEFGYLWYDFTANVRSHWIKNYQVGEMLRGAFEREGNAFLYEARVAENRSFKENAEQKAIFRYLYVVYKSKTGNAVDVREDHAHLQPGLGQQCPAAGFVHRCARIAAPVEGAGYRF